MNRKILVFGGGMLGLIIIVVGFILFLNSKSKSATDNQTENNTDSALISDEEIASSNSKIKKLSDSPVIAPILSFDGKAIWFFTNDGHLYKVNLSTGLKQEYLLPARLEVLDGIWPKQGNDFIIVSSGSGSKTFNYYNSDDKDSADQKFITYPSNMKEVDFLPDGKHIAYNWVTTTGSSLAIATFDTKSFQNIVSLPDKDLNVTVSSRGDKIFAFNKSGADGKLYYVTVPDKKIVTLRTSQENGAVWSPDGRRFIWNLDSGDGSRNDKLWLGDSESRSNKDLTLNGSIWKVAFDKTGQNIYVAANDGGSDSFWKVNSSTLVKTKIFSGSDAGSMKINASNLLVSDDGATLYFKNSDGFLYSIPAK